MSEEKIWLLDGTNFGNWKFRMEVLLEAKGLLNCVAEPLDLAAFAELQSDTQDQKLQKRTRRAERVAKDRSCRNLLVNRIAEDQLDHVKDARTAKETWDALRNTFERVGIAGKLFLKKRFQELRLAEGGDVPAFLVQFDKLLRELKAAGVKMEKEDVVCQLLLALPRSFNALVTAVETIEPKDVTLEYIKKRLLDEQAKRNGQDVPSEEESCPGESSFVSRRRRALKCFGCGGYGHKRADCPDGRSDEMESERSWRSGKSGRANVTSENEIAFGVATGNVADWSLPTVGRKVEWFLDSGATSHMVRDKSLFEELRPLARKVHIAVAKSGQSLVAQAIGTVRIRMLVKGRWLQAVVNDVLYVPELRSNLFSVRRLEDVGMTVKFAGGRVSIEKGDRMVGSGRRSGQLYALDVFRRAGVGDAEEQPEDVPADKPPRDSENEGKEVRIAGSLGRQPGVAEMLEAEDKEGPTGALPSQPERDNCSADVCTRPSGRERKILGKFLATVTRLGGSTAGGRFTDSTTEDPNVIQASGAGAGTIVENPEPLDKMKRCGHKREVPKLLKETRSFKWMFKIKRSAREDRKH